MSEVKDFIKKAHENACSEWKTNIEKEFPELFKEDALVVGKWYESGGNLFNVMSVVDYTWCLCYGFDRNGWLYNSKRCINNESSVRPATDKEVEQALIKEAKKRGFKEGVNYKTASERLVQELVFNKLQFNQDGNGGYLTDGCRGSIFEYGKWATILETITKEQAEKELGKTIIN